MNNIKDPAEAARHLLEEIQYPLIHFADFLRKEKKSAQLIDLPINLLTALLSISMNQTYFFPANISYRWDNDNKHSAYKSSKCIDLFLQNIPQLINLMNTLSGKFSENDRIQVIDSCRLVAESKTLLLQKIPRQHNNQLFIRAPYGANVQQLTAHFIYIQHAELFPCFKTFCKLYAFERDDTFINFSKIIPQRFFSNPSAPPRMYQLIASDQISTFRAVIQYAIQKPKSRTAQVLKEHFGIDVNEPKEILKKLNRHTQLPSVLQNLIVEYTSQLFPLGKNQQ